jgi:hypothetical protein
MPYFEKTYAQGLPGIKKITFLKDRISFIICKPFNYT